MMEPPARFIPEQSNSNRQSQSQQFPHPILLRIVQVLVLECELRRHLLLPGVGVEVDVVALN